MEKKLQSLDSVPTVMNSHDFEPVSSSQGKASLSSRLLRCYISVAQGIVRHNADVVMLTHLVLYFATSVPSAVLLFYHFTWPHAIVHLLMQLWYMPAYNLLMHQHIHQRGLLQPAFGSFDELFPYVLGPLMGHTWNSYYFHHVKHHHVEGNGPRDLSSTLRYRRDSAAHFAHYFAAFFLGTWVRLPLYFARRRQWANAARMFAWETASMALIAASVAARPRPAVFALLLPCMLLRLGLMLGNWGQHAFIDPDKPNSDFRSSLTLIDVTVRGPCAGVCCIWRGQGADSCDRAAGIASTTGITLRTTSTPGNYVGHGSKNLPS